MKNTRDLYNVNMKASNNQFSPITTTTTLVPCSTSSNLLGLGGSDSMNDGISEQPSSRWNPTTEQVLALEEMYRRGTRTPSADQIQQIASQLRRFGKIEGKNVFYWFQNHKARERQKRRRESDFNTTPKLHAGFLEEDNNTHSGTFQHQQKKTLLVSSNCTEYLEGTFPLHRAESTIENNCGWPEKKNYTWHDLNNPTKTTTTSSSMMLKSRNNNVELEEVEIETLELFPVSKSSDEDCNTGIGIGTGTRKRLARPIHTNQYFEFLKENRN